MVVPSTLTTNPKPLVFNFTDIGIFVFIRLLFERIKEIGHYKKYVL